MCKSTQFAHFGLFIIKLSAWATTCCGRRCRRCGASVRFDNVVVIFVLVERLRLRRRRIFSAANERRGRVESLSEAVAIPSEVVGDEVFVDVAAVA